MIVNLFEKEINAKPLTTIDDHWRPSICVYENPRPCWSCLPKTKKVLLYELFWNYPISRIVGQDQTEFYVLCHCIYTYIHESIRTFIHRYIQYMTHFGPITIHLTSLKFHWSCLTWKFQLQEASMKLPEGWLSPSLAGAGGSAQVFRGQWKGQEAIPRISGKRKEEERL